MSTKITTHYFEYGVHKYFRGNAHLVEPGTFGEKKDPLGIKAYIEPAGVIKPAYLDGRLKVNTRVKIDWSTVSSGDLQTGATLKFLSLGVSAATSFDYNKAKTAKLELVNLSIDEIPLVRMLNDADVARSFLAEEGADGRVVSEYWIVVEAQLGEYFAANAGAAVAVKAFGNQANLTIGGGTQGSQTLTMSPGTTFAYKLHKVSDWSKGKDSVLKVEADYKGMS